MISLKDICKEIEKAARETGAFILKESEGFDISRTESKGFNDFVSYVDKGSEKMLVEKLSRLLPEAGFITEEGTSKKRGLKYCWVIDPLDGTTNFLHGVHPYAISLALMEYEEVIAGVVYEVGGNEIFTAWKDGGAWLNGKAIHVSKTIKLSDSLLATGFPYNNFDRLTPYMNCLTYLVKNTHGIRRLGSAAIDLAYVACGRFEAFYEYGLNQWDIAAGMLLVREAGGRVSDFSGIEKNVTGEEIVAANNSVFSEVLEIVSKFMKN
ncbi:MAG: inositol monophosphatase family protein [Bacteroidia bacterium]|jgi:myo-inositol-1(or 4)-monophosphatase|nr:inositol monophosphatase family protein [Bacteroidia bacterium]